MRHLPGGAFFSQKPNEENSESPGQSPLAYFHSRKRLKCASIRTTILTRVWVPIFYGGFVPTKDQKPEIPIVSMAADTRAEISDVRSDYSKNYAKYFAYARLFTPSRNSAEDLVQQAFLNVIDALEKGHTILDNTLSAYIKRIIRNISISNHRVDSVQPMLRIVDAENPSPESEYALSSDKEIVAKAITGLSETQRAIIVMHYFDGLKVREIAEELEITSSSVKTHLQRARQNIATAVSADKSFPAEN